MSGKGIVHSEHPIYISGRLTESLAELERRIRVGCDVELVLSQLRRVNLCVGDLEKSLQKYGEAINAFDFAASVEWALEQEQCKATGKGGQA